MEASAVEKNNTVQSVYFFAYLVVSLFSLSSTETWATTNCRCSTPLCFPNYNIWPKCKYHLWHVPQTRFLKFSQQFNYIFILSSHTQKTESQRTGLDTGSGPLRLQHHVARSVSKKKKLSPNFGERFIWPLLRVGARLAANPLPKLSLLVKSGSSPVIPSGEQLF